MFVTTMCPAKMAEPPNTIGGGADSNVPNQIGHIWVLVGDAD